MQTGLHFKNDGPSKFSEFPQTVRHLHPITLYDFTRASHVTIKLIYATLFKCEFVYIYAYLHDEYD